MRGTTLFKRLISFGLAVVIAHLGLKFYLYQQIKSEVDELVLGASPFADIEYDSISTSLLKNSFSIHGIRIMSTGSNSPVEVEQLKLFGANFLSKKSQWFENLSVDKESYMGVQLSGLKFKVEDQPLANHPMLKQSQNMNLMKNLGYASMNTDLRLSIKTQPNTKTLELNFEQFHDDMFALGLKASFRVNGLNFNGPSSAQDLQMIQASLQYVDNSFLDKYIRYEAKRQGKSVESYKKDAILLFKKNLQAQNIELSEKQMTAISNTIQQSQSLKLSIKPTNPMGIQTFSRLHLYSPKDVSSLLNLDITNP